MKINGTAHVAARWSGGVMALAAALGSFGLVGCSKHKHPGAGGVAAASARPSSVARRKTPPIKLEVGDSTWRPGPSVRTDWGSCQARARDGDLVVSCYSERPLKIHGQAKGVAKVAGTQQGRETIAKLSLFPTVLAMLADVKVPAPKRPYGGGQLEPVDLAHDIDVKSPTVKVDAEARFTVTTFDEVTHGTVAPFERKRSKLISEQLPRLAGLAQHTGEGLLFPGETPRTAAKAAHSVLFISAESDYSFVTRKDEMMYGLRVLGPAKQVKDTDWLATEQSSFADADKKCGGYRAKSGPDKGKVMSLPLFFEHKTVVLRERRTGKLVSQTSFDAAKRCPVGYDYRYQKQTRSTVDPAKVEHWLLDQIKKAH